MAHFPGVLYKSNKEEAEVSNVEVFQSLQRHPTWGAFFATFGDGGIYNHGQLEVGEKFAKGAQTEIYHAHVTWKDSKHKLEAEKLDYKFVLKVYWKGTFLRDLQKQWPKGLFQDYEEVVECSKRGEYPTRYTSNIIRGTLLQDGRFGFLLARENEDLRTLIDRCMKARACIDFGPFPKEMAIKIMYKIARGVVRLHNLNIVQRYFKASNVSCSWFNMETKTYDWDYNVINVEVVVEHNFGCFVVDFECSIGVVGIGFFRAPKILQVLEDKALKKNPNPFTKETDVYSYGMLCYEILTGELPFEGHSTNDYDLVLEGS